MKKNFEKQYKQSGQAMISILLVLALSLIFITTTAMIYLTEGDLSFNTKKSNEIYYNGEAALEDAIMKLVRNSNYSGETLTLDDGSAIISVVLGPGPDQKTINVKSISNSGKYIRNLSAVVGTGGRIISLVSWRENE